MGIDVDVLYGRISKQLKDLFGEELKEPTEDVKKLSDYHDDHCAVAINTEYNGIIGCQVLWSCDGSECRTMNSVDLRFRYEGDMPCTDEVWLLWRYPLIAGTLMWVDPKYYPRIIEMIRSF